MKKRSLIGLFAGILAAGVATAGDLVLSAYWQDHMVLQRGKPITVWGKDAAGRTVTVAFAGQTATAVPGVDGVWETTFAEAFALSAAPQTLTVSDSAGESIELRDVLVGDVFLAAGQSNMDRTLSYKVSFQEPQGVKDFCRDDDGIRFIRIARSAEQSRIGEEQLFDLPPIKAVDDTIKYYGDGHDWAAAKGDDRNYVSSVALNFARYIRDANAAKGQDVPIGIIHASSGGTAIRQWLSADVLKKNGYKLEPSDGWYWNSMMAPILRAKFRAVLWYQGCSDAMMQPDEYKGLMDVLVKDRRDRWGENGDLPFYAVQIGTPGYGPSTGTIGLDKYPAPTENLIGSNYVRVREGQRLWDASETGPHGLATIVDFVRCMDSGDLHPTDKNFVGRRLSLFARRDIYGEADLQAEGPVFSRAVREADGKVRITFRPGTSKGLTSGRLKMAGELSVSRFVKESGPVKGFALCDAGGNWKDADVTVEGETVVLRAEGVSVPAKFHYGYWCITRTDNTEFGQRLSLYNDDGLPLSPLAPMSVEDANTGAKAADPVFSPVPGFFNPSTNVTISCATTGATIRYTIDGSEPTESSAAYEGPISISATTTVKARAFAAGKEPSGLAVATYVLGTPEAPTADPLWSLGSYDASAWTPLANNILAGKVGTTSGGLAFTSSGYNNNPANLTDGAVPASPDNSKYVGFQQGSSVTWTFDDPQTITEIRCSTQRVPNGDVATALMYAGIHIEDVYVMRSGSADWEALGVPVYQGRAAVEYGTLMAVLADDGIGRLADNVIGLKIAFLKGEVYWSNLAEIEAVGYTTADGPVAPLPPGPPDQPEQPEQPGDPGTDDPPDQPPVSKEGLWTTGEYNPATWTPLRGNILAEKTGKTSGTLAWESATKDATVLTDGKVPSAADDGAIVGFCDNAAIEWTFDEAVDLEKVRLTTRWTENEAYALRKHQAGVCVKDVLVRGADETTWTSLDTTLTLKGSGSSAGAMFATLADETSGILAKDATGLKIVFGKGEVVWNCYAEIEAVGKTGGDEPEEPPDDPPSASVRNWTTSDYDPSSWSKLDNNILAGLTPTVVNPGLIAYDAKDLSKLTDGSVPYPATLDETVGLRPGAELVWTFDEPQVVEQLRFSSLSADRKLFAGVSVSNILVKTSRSSDWVSLDIRFSRSGEVSSAGAQYAVFADTGLGYLALDVVSLKIVSGDVTAFANYYAEIEAVGMKSSEAPAAPPVLGALKVVPWGDSAEFHGSLVSVGTGASKCDVTLAYGPDAEHLGEPVVIYSGNISAFDYELKGLELNTAYCYRLAASNDAETVMGCVFDGAFTTTGEVRPDWSDVKWAVIGDSLTDPTLPPGEGNYYYDFVARDTGIQLAYLNGVGSTGYKNKQDMNKCFYQRLLADPLPDDVDVVTIFGSVNDWGQVRNEADAGSPSDTLADGKTTLAAYVNEAIDVIEAQAPKATIALVGSLYYYNVVEAAHVRANETLRAVAAARGIAFYDWLTKSPDDPLDFHHIADNPTAEGSFAQRYTRDCPKTIIPGETQFGHPSAEYHEVWLSPHFRGVLAEALVSAKAIRLDEPAARPSTDYNGSAVSVAFTGEIPNGAAVSAKITIGGVDYAGTVGEGVVTFAVPSDVVTAGNVYAGTVTMTVDGTDYTKPVTLEQGTIRIDADAAWVSESAAAFGTTGEWSGDAAEVAGDAIAVSNALFTSAKPSPANAVVTITSTFAFKGTSEETFNPAAQAGVKVVKVGAARRYAFLTGEGVVTNLEVAADVSAAVCVTVTLDRVAHTVAYAIGDAAFGPFPGVAEKGAVSKVRYAGATEVGVLTGSYRAEWLDSNLAQAGGVEYATVAEALAAGASPVRLLWDATWAPSAAGDYAIAKDGFSLVIGGALAYEVKDNGDGTVTVSVVGEESAEKPAPASITMSGDSIKVGVKDAKANYWYALEKTTDLAKEFVVDETTWVKGSEILAGEKELEMALVLEDKSAFYRVVVSTTAPEQKGEE